MKRYEVMMILNTTGKEENVQEQIDRIKADLQKDGIKVSSIQKLDRRPFSYKSGRHSSGFYVNFVVEADPDAADKLKTRFKLDPDVFRVQVSNAPVMLKTRKSKSEPAAV